MREVRCFPLGDGGASGELNSWAGLPGRCGVDPFWLLRAVVEGPIDARTGFLCNIQEIDRVLRDEAAPQLQERTILDADVADAIPMALPLVFAATARRCPARGVLRRLTVCVSPFLRFCVRDEDPTMVLLTQSFEFSAAHRLYCPEMDESENKRLFGKCGNPNGHGHNYVLEVTVGGQPDERSGRVVDLHQLNRTVRELIIDRFDHKHLNLDCQEFESLNPSVENIARVIWQRLAPAIEARRLVKVRVWETPKTYAEYAGEDHPAG